MKNIIPQDRVLKLNDPNITKREYDAIIEEIGERVDYVWHELLKISGRRLNWYAFQNDIEYDDGDGSSGGSFDPETDGEFIELSGDYASREVDGDFATGFPTRFLWTDDDIWTKEVLNHIAQNKAKVKTAKQAEKQKTELAKVARTKAIESIKSKLTKEELKYVSFK